MVQDFISKYFEKYFEMKSFIIFHNNNKEFFMSTLAISLKGACNSFSRLGLEQSTSLYMTGLIKRVQEQKSLSDLQNLFETTQTPVARSLIKVSTIEVMIRCEEIGLALTNPLPIFVNKKFCKDASWYFKSLQQYAHIPLEVKVCSVSLVKEGYYKQKVLLIVDIAFLKN